MAWLAVASARTPSTPATTCADATSHTLVSVRISGAVCRSSRVWACSRSSVIGGLYARGGRRRAARLNRRVVRVVTPTTQAARVWGLAQGTGGGLRPELAEDYRAFDTTRRTT